MATRLRPPIDCHTPRTFGGDRWPIRRIEIERDLVPINELSIIQDIAAALEAQPLRFPQQGKLPRRWRSLCNLRNAKESIPNDKNTDTVPLGLALLSSPAFAAKTAYHCVDKNKNEIRALPHRRGSDSFPLQDEPLYGESGMSRALRSSTPARPYMALDRLQSIHLPLDWPVAPGFGDGRLHGENVALQSGLKNLNQGNPGRPRAGHPLVKAVTVRGDGRTVVPAAGGDCLSSARKPIISERITA